MNVLSVVDNDYPKDSKYFKAVVREAATQVYFLGSSVAFLFSECPHQCAYFLLNHFCFSNLGSHIAV